MNKQIGTNETKLFIETNLNLFINPKMHGQELVSVGSVQKRIGVIATT